MSKFMLRKKSLVEEFEKDIRQKMNDIEPRPLKIEDVKNRAYPKV